MFGNKPYDKRINPSENLLVSFLALGEGFHNYHHTFPQDYSTSEYGWNFLNPTRAFIDFMALIGQAYDRNKMEKDTILKRKLRTGSFNTIDEKIN
jgi:stearoyl-CoA desaturase (Delta-9 desaturase)